MIGLGSPSAQRIAVCYIVFMHYETFEARGVKYAIRKNWSLTSLQQRLLVVKTGGRLVKHARYYWLLLAEGHLSWRLFGSILPGQFCLT